MKRVIAVVMGLELIILTIFLIIYFKFYDVVGKEKLFDFTKMVLPSLLAGVVAIVSLLFTVIFQEQQFRNKAKPFLILSSVQVSTELMINELVEDVIIADNSDSLRKVKCRLSNNNMLALNVCVESIDGRILISNRLDNNILELRLGLNAQSGLLIFNFSDFIGTKYKQIFEYHYMKNNTYEFNLCKTERL